MSNALKKRRKYQREWKAINPDKVREYRKRHYLKHKVRCSKYNKQYYQKHKKSIKKRTKEYYKSHKEEYRWKEIHREYHLGSIWQETKKIWINQFKKQKGRCAICGRKETDKLKNVKKRLAVDHNHKTGKIRGLLCKNCNTALGKLQADKGIKLLRKAISYLRK